MVYKYGFEEYWEDAKGNPTQENLKTLAEWFQEFDSESWDGEAYIIDKSTCLKPIYDDESIIGWELKDY